MWKMQEKKNNCLVILFLNISMIALSQTTDPLDTIFPKSQILSIDEFSYLIEEDSLYDFFVNDIICLQRGFMIHLTTIKDSTSVNCFVVSPKRRNSKGMKLKKGGHYMLFLRRYNSIPTRATIEAVDVSDFLLGGETVSVNEDGTYKYMFFSPLLSGKRIKEKSGWEHAKSAFVKDSSEIIHFIHDFIDMIGEGFSQERLYSMCDTVSMKRAMKKYAVYNQGRRPRDLPHQHALKYPWTINQSPPCLYSKKDLRQNNLFQLFSEMLYKEYRLPSKSSRDSTLIIKMQMFYSCNTSLYTIKVVWEDTYLKKRYVAVCDIKRRLNGFVLSSFNKPYRGYRLYSEENNIRYVPY
jgi:hypothetical protein